MRWIDGLSDNDFRVVYEHPDIIKCSECEFNSDGLCGNIYSYPKIPSDFVGCKNGRLKQGYIDNSKYSIIDKIKCFFGFHKERFIGQLQPFCNEMLIKCDCCGKYYLWHRGINCGYWFKRKDRYKGLTKSAIEMMDKYKL